MPKLSKDDEIDPADSDFFRMAGLRLRAIRKLSGLNQTEIAALLGVDQSTWSKWETGKRIPNPAKVAKFVARSKTTLELIYRGLPAGTHPALLALLRVTAPELLAPEPTDMDPGTDMALALYRDSIRQPGEGSR